ncbi:MAG: (2Fe-2S)-binding protein [Proteobacteria bacterium]|nr:(2Fe-2S)-binding protein [Pseudomonadota bacterium]
MYVCICRAVTEKHIETAVQGGARRLRDLRQQLGVTEECGRCAQCAKQCLDGAVEQACASACSSVADSAYSQLLIAA